MRGQASQGIHIDVMVAELWCGWSSGCTGRGGGRSWRSSCKWNRIYSWLNRKQSIMGGKKSILQSACCSVIPVVTIGSISSGGLVSFFGAESCSSKFFSFSLSLSRFPGFSSLMSKDRFLQSTSISNLRLSCEERIVGLSKNYFHWKLMYHKFSVNESNRPLSHVPGGAPPVHSWCPWSKGSAVWRSTKQGTNC